MNQAQALIKYVNLHFLSITRKLSAHIVKNAPNAVAEKKATEMKHQTQKTSSEAACCEVVGTF